MDIDCARDRCFSCRPIPLADPATRLAIEKPAVFVSGFFCLGIVAGASRN